MSEPTTRAEFISYCKRRLGYPVITINVEDTQVDDRVDEALQYFYENHSDGSEKIYRKHQVTQTDITNGYITLPEEYLNIVRIFRLETNGSGLSNPFNVEYQFALAEMHTLASTGGLQYYTTTKSYLNMMQDIFSGEKSFRFSRHKDRLHIDFDWANSVAVGDWIVIEAYRYILAADNSDVWNDIFLKRYATALIKRQWGLNMKKFQGIQLPGNLQFDGQRIYEEAEEEIKQLETEMYDKYAEPPDFFVA